MKYKIIDEKDPYLNSIREHVRTIRNILFDDDNSFKKQIGSIAKAELMESLDYLEKQKDTLPDSCRREMECVLKKVRQIISDRYRIL
jgi:predicted transcriptional regulator